MFTQQAEQTVTPDIQHVIGLSVQQIVQFTRTDPRLTTPDTDNKLKNLSMMFLSFSVPCVVLIPCLSAMPQELACTRNGYFWGRTLHEDLLGRFFLRHSPRNHFSVR